MRFDKCDRETFVSAIDEDKANRFAKTFVAKADLLGRWDSCVGAFDGTNLMGAVLWTYSAKAPVVCNLQLLHTFASYRGCGVGRQLVSLVTEAALSDRAEYFRVSAEPDAVIFYEKIGLKFWGRQKSGSQLCMFKFPGIYDANDPVIQRALDRKGKGGLVERFDMYYQSIESVTPIYDRL